LGRKVNGSKSQLPQPVVKSMPGAEIGIISMGSTDPAVIEARDQMLQQGILTDYLRVRAIPFSEEVTEFIKNHKRTYVVEINRDGQLKQLLTLETPEFAMKLRQVSHLDGLALSAKWVRETILAQEVNEQ
jgi:2-oxoglutarate ferredoxin oxidoreductase subunit alpha